jgi:hypothetical protein
MTERNRAPTDQTAAPVRPARAKGVRIAAGTEGLCRRHSPVACAGSRIVSTATAATTVTATPRR